MDFCVSMSVEVDANVEEALFGNVMKLSNSTFDPVPVALALFAKEMVKRLVAVAVYEEVVNVNATPERMRSRPAGFTIEQRFWFVDDAESGNTISRTTEVAVTDPVSVTGPLMVTPSWKVVTPAKIEADNAITAPNTTFPACLYCIAVEVGG